MDQSLSLVLPVYNAQANLAHQVANLLEMLPEMTSNFEVLIVDDGSSDRTEEVAYELAIRYPQIRVARHAVRRGLSASVKTGLRLTRGDVVIVQENDAISPTQLKKLWELRHDRELVMARADPQPHEIDAGVVDRLIAWGNSFKKEPRTRLAVHGIRMIRRQALQHCGEDERFSVETL